MASTAALASPLTTATPFSWKNTEYVLTFGDSYTFIQGTEGRWAYSFIGSQLNISFTPEQLLGDHIVPGQNTSSAGGSNWIQELTGCKEGYPRDCEKQLWGFAYAGADISTTFVPLHWNHTISYENQIHQWDTYGKTVINADSTKSLVASWIGINDINDMANFKLPFNGLSTWQELYTAVIAEQFAALETVYNAGYRNFLFLNLPPLDKTVNPARLPSTSMIKTFNDVVNQTAKAFSEKHPGSTALVFDTYSWLTNVFNNAASYGITNTTSFCPSYKAWDIDTNYAAYGCQPIGEYFWYNSGHITYSAHNVLAEKVEEFLLSKSVGRCGGKNQTESDWGTRWINGKST
ncbi:acetylesterase [Colletotrichum liriopes]|uniref:Acetylesterase n=1 Tax=Colletotrichum liriopes TaxID=708192 RepID=A0AA37GHA9_9PEZI|nr:acetylesterase [Colletotrichum liriopes]